MNLYEAKWIDAKKAQYYKEHPENCAGPDGSYPIEDASDVGDAWGLAGHADNPDAVRSKIISIAKRLGFTNALPDTAKDFDKDDKTQESAPAQIIESKDRIARIKSYFIEDNATSLNGRKYPREAVDKLLASINRKLVDPNELPMTSYLSHDDADGGITKNLVGKVSGAGREGTRGYVWLDVPNTQAGRDSLVLARGGYIKSQSLRASGARMYTSNESSVPLVGGDLEFDGIDWTTTPGLRQVARIADIVTESNEPQILNEVFHANLLVEENPMDPKEKVKEESLQPLASGDSPSVSGTDTQDEYSKRMMKPAPGVDTSEYPQTLNDVHDHLACAMGMECAPSAMERDASLKFLGITEAGAKFSQKTAKHLAAAHDGVAAHLQKSCVGNGSAAASSNMDDGSQEQKTYTQQELEQIVQERIKAQAILSEIRSLSNVTTEKSTQKQIAKEASKPMTPEERAQLLEELQKDGFKIEPPKTEEEKFQEALDARLEEKLNAMQAAFEKKLEESERKAQQLRYASYSQRKSLVEGSNVQEQQQQAPKRTHYRHGDYLREQLRSVELREQLLDRSRPIPKEINPEHAINELKLELLGIYDETWGLTGDPVRFRR